MQQAREHPADRGEAIAIALLAAPARQADRTGQAFLATAGPLLAQAADRLGELPVDILQTLFWSLDPWLAVKKFGRFLGMDQQGNSAREFVLLDIGARSEAVADLAHFRNEDGTLRIATGEPLELYVVEADDQVVLAPSLRADPGASLGQMRAAFMLPAGVWQALLDTSHPRGLASWHGQGEVPFTLPAHSLVVLAAAGASISGLPT